MKLKAIEFENLAYEKGYKSGQQLWLALRGGDEALPLLIPGERQIGYEMVKAIFNAFGQSVTERVVDFEDETMESFEAKYFKVGTKLSGITDIEESASEDINAYECALVYLLAHGEPKDKVFPEWYFDRRAFTINKRKFKKWKEKNNLSWQYISDELGIPIKTIKRNICKEKIWTMMDLLCFVELMGTEGLIKVLQFKTQKSEDAIKKKIKKECKLNE